MRLDNRDKKRKSRLTATEVLGLLKSLKPFPVEPHKGWKLNCFHHGCRVWTQEISPNNSDLGLDVFAVFTKVRVPPQLILQILKDVTKTSSWKPGCLAISITSSKPQEPEMGTRNRGIVLTPVPVNHDIVMEESSYGEKDSGGFLHFLMSKHSSVLTMTKEYKRYWYREDNGVCWHLQMSETTQEWLFFLAQPVEEVDKCLLTVVGYMDESNHTSASYVSQILGSFKDYILYRKVQSTPLLDIKLPHSKPEKKIQQLSSSDETYAHSAGKRLYLRFRSLVESPTFGADKVQSAKRQLVKSASILRHRYLPFSDLKKDLKKENLTLSQSLKTGSLDRSLSHNINRTAADEFRPRSQSVTVEGSEVKSEQNNSIVGNTQDSNENNNVLKTESVTSTVEKSDKENKGSEVTEEKGDSDSGELSDLSETSDKVKDMDKILDEDFSFEQGVEREDIESSESKEDIQHIVAANQTAAELLSVAVQASNIDLNKSIEEQVLLSGGWMFCGLENDVVVLKKISVNQNIQCYLGKGVIQATPQTVWNAIKNPRTKFTYDESLKKVDVLETVSEYVKIVYYYHEVLQLFKKECYDMVVMQSERVDGDKYLIAMESEERQGVTSPDGTFRVKVLPSGWIIEPIKRDKKVFSMATYIMQIDFGSVQAGVDRAPYEDLIAKQPLSIAYLRQYLRPSALWIDKTQKS